MAAQEEYLQSKRSAINEALDSGTFTPLKRLLNSLSPADVAHLLESSPPKDRALLWRLVDSDQEANILQNLNDDIRFEFLQAMNTEQLVSITENLEIDEVADLLQQLPETILHQVLSSMDSMDRARVEQVLSFPEDTAGGLMDTDTITVRPDLSLEVVLRYLRRHDTLPRSTDNVIVVNRKDEFIGVLPLIKLLTTDPSVTVREVMLTDQIVIKADTPDTEVANLFERHDLVSAPVIDEQGRLLGRITIDDVVDVIREDADHSLMSMAGLDEDEDTFAPIFKTSRRRAVWLGINLITAFIASAVINLFQETIEKVVALAVLMPIVASMGGIAGSQTLTLVIRAMALGQIGTSNVSWLLNRELAVGAINGILWALVVAVSAGAVFNDMILAGVIAVAMVINLVTAAISGAALPLILRAMNIDPALAGGVILTTVTDVVGFMSFLGLATYFYG